MEQEYAQVIDVHTASDGERWYEFWSLEKKQRFSFKMRRERQCPTVGALTRIVRSGKSTNIYLIPARKLPADLKDALVLDVPRLRRTRGLGIRSIRASGSPKVTDKKDQLPPRDDKQGHIGSTLASVA